MASVFAILYGFIFIIHIMLDGYFKILELKQTQDLGQIKTAYKKLASKYHPDKNLQNKHWAEEKFKLISESYRLILKELGSHTSNAFEGLESFYRPEQQKYYESKIPNYWDTIRNSHHPEDQAKLILHELEQENSKEGLRLFDTLASEMYGIDPLSLLGSANYFDACFLLAESLEKAHRYIAAVGYYSIYYQYIRIQLHQRKFSEDLKLKIVKLYKNKICKASLKSDDAIKSFLIMLRQVSFNNKEKAKLLKDLASLYVKNKEADQANSVLKEAQKLDPDLKGLDKLMAQIKDLENL